MKHSGGLSPVRSLTGLHSALILLFLYAPMAVMFVFSFNTGVSTSSLSGFSLRWYADLAGNLAVRRALGNTLVLALLAAAAAVVLGTVAAIGIDRMRRRRLQSATLSLTNLPMMNPDIVTGISMMLLFVFGARLLGLRQALGFGTLLAAHITFCLPYVILSVLPKLRQLDPHLQEAAQDLGCSQLQAFAKIVLPSIASGVLSAFLMAVTLSLDDFVISYFVSGTEYQTLPLYIYSMTKRRVKPDMYALSTLIFVAIFLLLVSSNVLQARAEKRQERLMKKKGRKLSMSEREEGVRLALDFKKLARLKGCRVLPVAVQNARTMEVILLAYVNEKALRETIRLGKAVFFSTSRRRLWYKGSEESGNSFALEEIRVNCEQNSLVFLVTPERGGICHTKNTDGSHRNCYYRRLNLQTGELEFLEQNL